MQRLWGQARKTLSMMLALLSLVLVPGVSSAQSIEDFASGIYVDHPQLSPDGRQYAIVTFRNGSPRITVFDRKTFSERKSIVGFGTASIGWVEFATDDTLLASITTEFRVEGGRIYWPTSRVISISITDRRPPVVLFENETRMMSRTFRLNRVVDMMPNAPELVTMGGYTKGDYDLFRVNIETGEAQKIANGTGYTMAWYTGADGLPSIRMDCTDKRCRRIRAYRPETNDAPYSLKTAWKAFRTFERGNPDEETLLNLQPVGPTGKPDEFFVLDGRDGVPRRAVRRYNIRTDSFVETLYEDPDYDVTGAIIDPVTREYRGAQVWRDRVDYVLADAELQSHLDGINRFFENDWNVSIREISRDRSAALLHASASDERGAYYLYDFATRETRKIGALNPSLHNAIDTTTRRLDIPMRDGTSVTAYLTEPEAATRHGLVVLVHGGPEARDVMDYDGDTQFMASRGYAVLRVNFRGSAGYGRAFAKAGYRNWGGVMHTDLIDATKHVQAAGHGTPDTTCIMGHSYGGYAALLAGAKQPGLYTCVVAGAGPSDLNQILRDERKDHGSSSQQLAYWEKSIGDRKRDKARLADISPRRLAGAFDDPVLLVHGEWDRVVDVEHSRTMQRALEKAGKDVSYLELPGCHHHSHWSSKSRRRYLTQLEAFLGEHIGTAPAGAGSPALQP